MGICRSKPCWCIASVGQSIFNSIVLKQIVIADELLGYCKIILLAFLTHLNGIMRNAMNWKYLKGVNRPVVPVVYM